MLHSSKLFPFTLIAINQNFYFAIYMKETRVSVVKIIIIYQKLLILTSNNLLQHYMCNVTLQNKKKHINNLPSIFPAIDEMHFPLIALKRLINSNGYDAAPCE